MKCISCNEQEPNKASGLCNDCEQVEQGKINGLLYLPAAGLIIALMYTPWELWEFCQAVLSYFHMAGIISWYAIGAILLIMLYMAITVFAALQFFRRRKKTPRAMAGYYLFGFISALYFTVLPATLFGAAFDQNDVRTLLSAAVGVVLWLPYFFISKRINRVFVF